MDHIIKIIVVTLVVSISMMFAQPAKSLAPLSLKELRSMCDSYLTDINNANSIQCARYLKGFIDGAGAIEPKVKTADVKQDNASSFSERAISTRIGNRVGKKQESWSFCLGKDHLLKEVVTNVAQDIQKLQDGNSLAKWAVYRSLKDNYPCQATS